MFQTKECGKPPEEKDLNEMEISKLPDKEFKITILKMLNDLGRRMEDHRVFFLNKAGFYCIPHPPPSPITREMR